MSDGAVPPDPETSDNGTSPTADIAAGATILLLTLVGWWTVTANPALVGTDYGADPGPGMMPQLTLALLTACALVMIVRGAFARRQTVWPRAAGARIAPSPIHALSIPCLMVATLIGYVLLFPIIGFIWTTLGFALLWCAILGVIEFPPATPGRLALYAGEAGTITFLVWLAFAELIGIPLP